MRSFHAHLEPVPHGGHYVVVPPSIADALGVVHNSRVRGTVNGVPFRSSTPKYSGDLHLGIPKAALAKAGAAGGDRVRVAIELDTEPLPTEVVPPDLEAALAANEAAASAWQRQRPSHRREHVKAILDAKKPETRTRRIAKAIEMLVSDRRGTTGA